MNTKRILQLPVGTTPVETDQFLCVQGLSGTPITRRMSFASLLTLFSTLFKGSWSGVTTYTVGQIVESGGSAYQCTATSLNQAPPNASYWRLVVAKGATGAAGSTWRNGSTAPDNALGVDGDLYLRTTNDDIYKKAGGVYSIVGNFKGATGDIREWLTGSGAPTSQGEDGDWYLDGLTGDIYGPKASGAWPGSPAANIKGPQGDPGADASGDVVGPSSAVADRIAMFDGTTGKLIKDGGVTVAQLQPIDATLTALAAITTAADKLIYATAADAFSTTDLTSSGRSLIGAASYSAMRGLLDLEAGTDFYSITAADAAFQPKDAELAALAGLSSAANKLPYFTGSGTAALADFTPAGFSLTLSANTTVGGTHSGTSSGSNTGDQTISLTGDVTGSGTGSFAATIANNAVTLAKMATMATASFLGRNTAATGNVEVLSAATALTLIGALPLAGGALTGAVTTTSTITLNGTGGDYIILNGSTGGTPKITLFNSGIGNIELTATGGQLVVNAVVAATGFSCTSSIYANGAIGSVNSGGSGGSITAAGILSLWSAASTATYITFTENAVANRGVLGYGAGSADLVLKTGGESFAAATTEIFRWSSAGTFTAIGDIVLSAVGKGLNIKEGTNARMGVATLVGGTVVVNTTAVTNNSRIFLCGENLGTITVPVGYAISARTAGTSFTILSANAIDTSNVAWMIVEPS